MINRRRSVASPAPFVVDFFTDTAGTALVDHVGEIGASWSNHPAAGGVAPEISDTGELRRGVHASVAMCFASGPPPSADYKVTAAFRFIDTASNDYAGIYARLATDANSGYLLQHEHFSGVHYWHLYSVSAGSYSSLGSAAGAASGVVTLRVTGNEITVLVDGVPTLSATNGDHPDAGRVGVRFDPSDDVADAIWLDNLSAT